MGRATSGSTAAEWGANCAILATSRASRASMSRGFLGMTSGGRDAVQPVACPPLVVFANG